MSDLTDMLSSFGFSPQEEVTHSCMAADPAKRTWARQVGRGEDSWTTYSVIAGYHWIAGYRQDRLLVKVLCLRIVFQDRSEYHSCIPFPDLTRAIENKRDMFPLGQFIQLVMEKLRDLYSIDRTEVQYGPNIGTPAESICLQQPLQWGRGTKQGMRDWLQSLTEEELTCLSNALK